MDRDSIEGIGKMKEIGGYIELDTYNLPMLHKKAIALNCGRNGLAYLLKSRGIKKLKIPYFICSSIPDVCDREGVEKSFYHVGLDFRPTELAVEDDEWLYLVNYYGQLSNDEIKQYVDKYERVIVDQANAYFQTPINDVDTIYTCRKWFGVTDGAFLYTNKKLNEELPIDESYARMRFLLGRYERTASEFYGEYTANNMFFATEPIKRMSKLTSNLLHGIDYEAVQAKRNENFCYLHERLGSINMLVLSSANFMYPFMVENGAVIRRKLQMNSVYIPTLWPTVFDLVAPDAIEYKMAENILPLPIDQRYGIEEMDYMIDLITNNFK